MDSNASANPTPSVMEPTPVTIPELYTRTYSTVVRVCKECKQVIENGMCTYQCPYDADLARPHDKEVKLRIVHTDVAKEI
jgi:hypothetical protein